MTIAERNNKLKHFITCLKCEVSGKCCDDNCSTQYDAGNIGEIIENLEAISKALEQEPFINKPCVSSEVCEHDKNKVLDKIREQIKSHLRGVEITLEVLVENDPLRPKMEGAKDTLEECLELIDKAEIEPQESEE